MISTHCAPWLIGSGGSAEAPSPAIVGSKAAGLARMSGLGLNVPPAFVLPTGLCAGIVAGDEAALTRLREGVAAGVEWLQAATGAKVRRLPRASFRFGALGRGKINARHA